ncbi:DUF1629 domain-containing protein [Burkholderia sp. 4M9327F10]|uniref:imm11 family protein n=1 Tax=Burkholderia sp. 4M9327F10 TaxID=2502223 RepID=UPI00148596D0|nr:DUF1629 domain-containing protein [Burkholderia sp. 4M9327F10]
MLLDQMTQNHRGESKLMIKNKERKFFRVSPNIRSTSVPGMKLLNKAELLQGKGKVLVPEIGQRGFPVYPEMPRFLFGKNLTQATRERVVHDIEKYGAYWLVSDRLKEIFERLDPSAFIFVRCEIEMQDKSEPPVYWLCDVVRVLDAIDEVTSKVQIKHYEDGRKYYSFLGETSLNFREDIDLSNHIFRLKYAMSAVFCDGEFKSDFKNFGITGMDFLAV